jgi:hypothetical protein
MWLLILVMSIGLSVSPSSAQEKQEKKPADRPNAVVAKGASITATVEAIDYDKRTVDLKGPKGNVVTLKVGPEAKNFNQVKTGDRVTAKYFESTAIQVRKPNEPPFAEKQSSVQVAPKGASPGGVAVETSEMTAVVDAINYKTRTVTLRGPQQKTVTLKVDDSVKRLNEVKKGDEIVIRRTEALAIDVKPAK